MEYARNLADNFWIGSGLEFSWDNKVPGANLIMFEVTGDEQFKDQLGYWKGAIEKRDRVRNPSGKSSRKSSGKSSRKSSGYPIYG